MGCGTSRNATAETAAVPPPPPKGAADGAGPDAKSASAPTNDVGATVSKGAGGNAAKGATAEQGAGSGGEGAGAGEDGVDAAGETTPPAADASSGDAKATSQGAGAEGGDGGDGGEPIEDEPAKGEADKPEEGEEEYSYRPKMSICFVSDSGVSEVYAPKIDFDEGGVALVEEEEGEENDHHLAQAFARLVDKENELDEIVHDAIALRQSEPDLLAEVDAIEGRELKDIKKPATDDEDAPEAKE